VRRVGVRLGNWLTREQGRRLLECAAPSTPASCGTTRWSPCSDRLRTPAPSAWPSVSSPSSNGRITGSLRIWSVRTAMCARSRSQRG
jgi:hypothetical protein